MEKIILHWRSGKKEKIEFINNSIIDSMSNSGYGYGAISALDFHTPENEENKWVLKDGKWELSKNKKEVIL